MLCSFQTKRWIFILVWEQWGRKRYTLETVQNKISKSKYFKSKYVIRLTFAKCFKVLSSWLFGHFNFPHWVPSISWFHKFSSHITEPCMMVPLSLTVLTMMFFCRQQNPPANCFQSITRLHPRCYTTTCFQQIVLLVAFGLTLQWVLDDGHCLADSQLHIFSP